MKKKYTKPEIIFESFTLSTNIANTCEVKPDSQTDFNTCGVDMGVIIFAQGLTGCADVKIDPYGEYDGICYHVPSDLKNIFTS